MIFEREGLCRVPHSASLHQQQADSGERASKSLTIIAPASTFSHFRSAPIPTLTLTTRRGTGYYKVPSFKGVWYRGPFEHNGSVATLEDWFDSRRLGDDYVPTGWKGYGVKTRAVKGHGVRAEAFADDKWH